MILVLKQIKRESVYMCMLWYMFFFYITVLSCCGICFSFISLSYLVVVYVFLLYHCPILLCTVLSCCGICFSFISLSYLVVVYVILLYHCPILLWYMFFFYITVLSCCGICFSFISLSYLVVVYVFLLYRCPILACQCIPIFTSDICVQIGLGQTAHVRIFHISQNNTTWAATYLLTCAPNEDHSENMHI